MKAKLITCLLLFLFFTPLPAKSATINVNSVGGCTLNDAIRSANADAARGDCSAGSGNDTIVLPDNFLLNSNSSIETISSTLTIRTATDNGMAGIEDDSHRVLRVNNANNVELRNLVLSGGLPGDIGDSGGPGLLVQNSSVSLINVRVTENHVGGESNRQGGGIKVENSTISLEGCSFSRNKAKSSITLDGRGGNLYLRDSSATINNTQFEGYPFKDAQFFYLSQSGAARGGGIYADNSSLSISNSTFTRQLTGSGGRKGVDLYLTNGTTASVSNSTFYHDRTNTGSRIYVEDSQLTLNNATVFTESSNYGIESQNGSISAFNSIFVGTAQYLGFCHATDANGDTVAFVLQQNVANLFPADDSCGTPQDTFSTSDIYSPAYNGGPTETGKLRPAANNPAINSADTATCTATDQRGFPRGAQCDIGAYESLDLVDLAVNMSLATAAPYYLNQLIEYQIVVQNLSPADVYDVDLSMNLTGATLSSYISGQSCTGLSCDIASIPSGGSVLIRMFVEKSGTPNFNAEAFVQSATGYSTDPNLDNNSDITGNGGSLSPAADLRVTQTLLTAGPHFVGQTVDYSVLVENLGPSTAIKVDLSRVLSGLSGGFWSGCNSVTSDVCRINGINSGSSVTVQYQSTINAIKATFESSAISDEYDPISSNNAGKTNLNTETDAELKIGMSITTAAPYYIDAAVQYAIQVVNSGPDAATNVFIDSLGENLVILNASNPCNTLPCEIPTIANGEVVNLTMGGDVLDVGSFSHTVEVYADQNDADLSNNIASVQKTVLPDADLQVTVPTLPSLTYEVGGEVTFMVIVRNNGSIPASNVDLSLTLTNLELINVTSLNCFSLLCTIPAMEVGAANQEVVEVLARIAAPGQFKLGAVVGSDIYDAILANNQVTSAGTAIPSSVNEIFDSSFEGEN